MLGAKANYSICHPVKALRYAVLLIIVSVVSICLYFYFQERDSRLENERNHDLIESFSRPPGGLQRQGRRVKVAVFAEEGVQDDSIASLGHILKVDPRMEARFISDVEIREGILNTFDVLVVPGGSATDKAIILGEAGRMAVIEFVQEGGGYVGICGGAFLASAGRENYLGIISARTMTGETLVDGVGMVSNAYRGGGIVRMELTGAGNEILGDCPGLVDIAYSGGPIFMAPSRTDYIALALYRSEISEYDFQRGTMTGTPAIIAGKFGKGHVIAISPHPEMMPVRELLLVRAILAASRKG
jgi:glutamine amidotransferase-like uncharacterized protein